MAEATCECGLTIREVVAMKQLLGRDSHNEYHRALANGTLEKAGL